MLSIVYISAMKKEYSCEQLKNLSEKFSEKNKINNITGLMIYYDKNIIQYIEGEYFDVKILYDTIAKDKTHKNIIKLLDEIIINRIFNNWHICFQENGQSKFIESAELEKNNVQSDNVIKLFNSFLKVNLRYDSRITKFLN